MPQEEHFSCYSLIIFPFTELLTIEPLHLVHWFSELNSRTSSVIFLFVWLLFFEVVIFKELVDPVNPVTDLFNSKTPVTAVLEVTDH